MDAIAWTAQILLQPQSTTRSVWPARIERMLKLHGKVSARMLADMYGVTRNNAVTALATYGPGLDIKVIGVEHVGPFNSRMNVWGRA